MTTLHRVGDRIDSSSSGRIPRWQTETSPTNATRGKRHRKRKYRDTRGQRV